MAEIEFGNVTKRFGSNTVIESLDLKIENGSFTVLVGPSGCGKTTLLRMIAGIGSQTSGQVLIDGTDVTEIAPGQRGVAMVFQNYAIYPTMSVRGNIEFGLKNNKIGKAERERLIKEAAEKVGLTDYLERMPNALSGGQRQRVALARAIVKNPSVFLMDEPLSNLDAKLRVQMRVELIELHKKLKTTFVYVTHDQVEAMSMADTIVLMDGGKIMQQASPKVMYQDPDNLFTACFIGSPAMNTGLLPDGKSRFGFRSERGQLSDERRDGAAYSFSGTIVAREMLGNETLYTVRDRAQISFVIKQLDDEWNDGDAACINVEEKHIYFFDETGNRIRKTDEAYGRCLALLKGM